VGIVSHRIARVGNLIFGLNLQIFLNFSLASAIHLHFPKYPTILKSKNPVSDANLIGFQNAKHMLDL
jgi:hypothetical protein